ncbi:hypothetical protein [Brevibacillus gelatini]|nr:hypothetical protein [Brevibacillus gelatini]
MSPEEILNEASLPRLQIECINVSGDYTEQLWKYELVYKHFTGDIVKVTIGQTERKTGRTKPPIGEDGEIDLPFRDGAHIKHDAIHLNLPAYAICDDIVEKLDLSSFKLKFPEKYSR